MGGTCRMCYGADYRISNKPMGTQMGYAIGFELLVYNGLLTLIGLLAISKRA